MKDPLAPARGLHVYTDKYYTSSQLAEELLKIGCHRTILEEMIEHYTYNQILNADDKMLPKSLLACVIEYSATRPNMPK